MWTPCSESTSPKPNSWSRSGRRTARCGARAAPIRRRLCAARRVAAAPQRHPRARLPRGHRHVWRRARDLAARRGASGQRGQSGDHSRLCPDPARAQQDRSARCGADRALHRHAAARPRGRRPRARSAQLQALVRRLDALHGMRTQEAIASRPASRSTRSARRSKRCWPSRRADRPCPAADSRSSRSASGLRAQRDLLTTIPGIGEATAAILIAELFDKRYTSARQAAAFAGLVPRSSNRARSAAARAYPRSGRGACGRRSTSRRHRATMESRRFAPCASGSAPPANRRWSSSARPCANSFTSPTASSNPGKRMNPRGPTLDEQHGISVLKTPWAPSNSSPSNTAISRTVQPGMIVLVHLITWRSDLR